MTTALLIVAMQAGIAALVLIAGEVIPTGVTTQTAVGDFGPTVWILGLVVAGVAGFATLYVRTKTMVLEMLDSRDGKKALRAALFDDESVTAEEYVSQVIHGGHKSLGERVWNDVIRKEDFTKWVGGRVESETKAKLDNVLGQMSASTAAVQGLTVEVRGLAGKLDNYLQKQIDFEERLLRIEVGKHHAGS